MCLVRMKMGASHIEEHFRNQTVNGPYVKEKFSGVQKKLMIVHR